MIEIAQKVHDLAIEVDGYSANYIRCINPESLEVAIQIIQEIKRTTYSRYLKFQIDKLISNLGDLKK